MTSGNTRVLIVVPTLGTRLDFLSVCLDSLHAQSYPDVRVVLVGPPDGPLPKIAASYGIDFLDQPELGIGAAVNAGWETFGSDAEVWGWLGDDDVLPIDSVRLAVQGLRRRNAVMAFGQCRYISEAGDTLWVAKPSQLAATNLGGGVDLIPQPGSLALADAVRRAGLLDTGLRYAMDYDLFLRLRRVGRLVYVPAILASFRWHADSLTATEGSGSEAESAMVRCRFRTGEWGRVRERLEPLTMKASKLHWHLQRRPLRLMARDLTRSLH